MTDSLIIPTLRLLAWLENATLYEGMQALGRTAALESHNAEMPVATWFASVADTDPEEAEALIRRGIEYMEKRDR